MPGCPFQPNPCGNYFGSKQLAVRAKPGADDPKADDSDVHVSQVNSSDPPSGRRRLPAPPRHVHGIDPAVSAMERGDAVDLRRRAAHVRPHLRRDGLRRRDRGPRLVSRHAGEEHRGARPRRDRHRVGVRPAALARGVSPDGADPTRRPARHGPEGDANVAADVLDLPALRAEPLAGDRRRDRRRRGRVLRAGPALARGDALEPQLPLPRGRAPPPRRGVRDVQPGEPLVSRGVPLHGADPDGDVHRGSRRRRAARAAADARRAQANLAAFLTSRPCAIVGPRNFAELRESHARVPRRPHARRGAGDGRPRAAGASRAASTRATGRGSS